MSRPDLEVDDRWDGTEVEVEVDNVGGIDSCSVSLTPGVTLFEGENATNRTSLLTAIAGALGGTDASIKSDADEGTVRLSIDGEVYERRFERAGGGVQTVGEGYTDDADTVDLFVSLLETNDVRRAVETDTGLYDVLMRPVDTAAIERRIQELKQEKTELNEELDRVETRRKRLPDLEQRRQELRSELSEVSEELSSLREEVAEYEADKRRAEGAEDLVDKLDERRQDLRGTEDEIEVVEAELDALETELEELREEREDLEAPSEDARAEVAADLESARERRRSVRETVQSLTSIVEFNESVLSEDAEDLPVVETGADDVAAELAPDSEREVTCWTCGSTVERAAISDRLDDLRSVVEEKREQRRQVESRIEELEAEKDDLEDAIARTERIDRQVSETERKLERKRDRLESLHEERSSLREEVADLEAEVAETEELRDTDLVEKYEQISDLQYRQGQLEQELDDVEADIEEVESLPDPATLREQVEEVTAELEDARSRIDRLERNVVDAFNDHMEDVLAVLGYDNLARVWIERLKVDGGRGAAETEFELHVVRESASGAGYEDVVSNLSESEREVIGLVLALSGYLVHDVGETVPFMLLDSVEAIDASRLGDLIDYFRDYAPYLLVAVLPEVSTALPDEFERIPASALS